MTRHTILCWPNRVDEGVLSGGAWSDSLPREHLQTPIPAQIAETIDLDPASTQVTLTLPSFRAIGVIAISAHNLSVDATWSVQVYYESGDTEPLWSSGWLNVWPAVYATNELNWEDPNFWSGVPSEDDRRDFTPLAKIFLEPKVAQRILIKIDDPSNSDGVVRLGRIFAAGVWRPKFNVSYGIQYGHQINTEFEIAGNADQTEYADVRTPRRTVNFSLDHLDEQEGFRRGLALQRQQGLHGEVLYAEDEQANPVSFARTFIGRLQSADPLTHPYYANYSQSYSLLEIL